MTVRDPSAVGMPVAYEPVGLTERSPDLRDALARAAQSEACRVRAERDALKRENEQLRAELEAERALRAIARRAGRAAVKVAICAIRERDQVGQERNEARATIAELGQLAERMAARAAAGAVAGEVPLAELSAAEHLGCPEYPEDPMLACGEAVLGAGQGVEKGDSCPRAAECHQVLAEKAPAIVQLHESTRRVVGP